MDTVFLKPEIVIPNYEPFVFNEAYFKYVSSEYPNGDPVILRKVTIINRYRQKSVYGLLLFMQDAVKYFSLKKKPANKPYNSSLEETIKSCPPEIQKDMLHAKARFVDYLAANLGSEFSNIPHHETDALMVNSGLIPNQIIQENPQFNQDSGWYTFTLESPELQEEHLGIQWKMQIRMHEGKFPRIRDLCTLVRHESRHSDILLVEGKYEKEEKLAHLRALSKAFENPHMLASLKDFTSEIMSNIAVDMILSYNQNIMNQRISLPTVSPKRYDGATIH